MEIIFLALLTLLASFIGTLAGFGISTVMVPVVALFFPFRETLLFVGIIHLFGNLWKILLFRVGVRLRLIIGFGAPALVASVIGSILVSRFSISGLENLLGMFLIFYVGVLLYNPKLRLIVTKKTTIGGGLLSGFAAGFFGIGGAIRSAFLTAYAFPKEVFLATNGFIALIVDFGRVGGYLASGVTLPARLYYSMLVYIPLSFIGAKLAKLSVNRISQRYFRAVVGIFLFLVGFRLLFY